MTDIDRRGFVGASALGLLGRWPPGAAIDGFRRLDRSVEAPPDATRLLAEYVVHARPDDLPGPVKIEAVRTLLNWAGCAVGGSHHETLDLTVRALSPFAGPPQASVLGRTERFDILH